MNDNPKTEPPNRLKETLVRRIAKAGEDDFMVKQLRRQIAAEETGLNSRQLFFGLNMRWYIFFQKTTKKHFEALALHKTKLFPFFS